MGKLSKEEDDQLKALQAKLEAPDEDDDDQDDDQDDDGGIIVLRGGRADRFLDSLLGPSKTKKKATGRDSAGSPAKTEGDDDRDEDEPEPPKPHRFFR